METLLLIHCSTYPDVELLDMVILPLFEEWPMFPCTANSVQASSFSLSFSLPLSLAAILIAIGSLEIRHFRSIVRLHVKGLQTADEKTIVQAQGCPAAVQFSLPSSLPNWSVSTVRLYQSPSSVQGLPDRRGAGRIRGKCSQEVRLTPGPRFPRPRQP